MTLKLHNWNLHDEDHCQNASIGWWGGVEGPDRAEPWRVAEMAALYAMQTQFYRYDDSSTALEILIDIPGTGASPREVTIDRKTYPIDEWHNVPPNIAWSIARRLHIQKDHPISV